jgi:hypothetical protein
MHRDDAICATGKLAARFQFPTADIYLLWKLLIVGISRDGFRGAGVA